MGASLRIEELTRRYAGSERPAVDRLDLTVEPGETVCLVGPSGCGKSTTLRLVAGLDHPDAGRVWIGEDDMTGVEPQARDVAMVFQGFALYPHMTVRDILAFPLKMRRVPKRARRQAVMRAADMLGLQALLDRRPAQLSGGERQRVAMGRAIVREPKVFLFDEPLSNLDAALRVELRVELGRLLRRLEATALYVTHDQAEAMTLGHRIALLSGGSLVQLDCPRRIYEEPASTFCAAFFGSPPMNLLDVEACEGRARIGTASVAAPRNGRLTLGIRPEALRVGASADEGAPTFTAAVTSVEPLGAETHLELAGDGATLRARVEGLDAPAIGSEVTVGIVPERIRWFDAETGRAL